MSSYTFVVVFSFFFLFVAHPPLATANNRWRCHPEDRQILNQINKEFNNMLAGSWNPETDCCKSWYGIGCNENTSRVISLAVQYDNFSGQFPPSISRIPYLQTLILHKMPNLTGELPPSYAKIANLNMLWITWTGLTGPIPVWLSQLKSLTYINLSYNRLTGTIPPSIPEMPNLTYLRLDRNLLTGTIPESFSRHKGGNLLLANNDLHGPVPPSLGGVDWETVELQRNRLAGDPSHLFSNRSKRLQHIDLSRNQFSFDLSSVVFPTVNLQAVDLNHNAIRGRIPEDIVNVPYLNGFNVSYNRLCGRIPTGGRMNQFDSSAYIHNSCLCGPPLSATCPNH